MRHRPRAADERLPRTLVAHETRGRQQRARRGGGEEDGERQRHQVAERGLVASAFLEAIGERYRSRHAPPLSFLGSSRDGAPAVPVALVASAAILFAVIYLAHGISLRTSAALLGTLTAMLLAAVLSWAAIELTHLTGLSDERNNEVAAYMGNVSITGMLLAGFIIGSLGVLNDVTITQSSAVFELAHLGPGPSTGAATNRRLRREVFLRAMRVGSDHIASTVYTLLLAYAGSSLPLLLLFSVANRSLSDVLTSEAVAIEIARSAVGGIALALAVPLTTAIATVLATPNAGPAGPASTAHNRT